MENKPNGRLLTLSEFRRELGIPLVLAKKLIVWGEVEAVWAIDGTLRIAGAEVLKARALIGNPWTKAKLFVKALGPGLITGASDDDPGGIGTYSAVGAKFGLGMLWMAPWLLPMMIAVQEACARIGIVTNKGLAAVLKENYKRRLVLGTVMLLIIANVINIGADLGAMAASLEMITGVDYYLGAIFFAVLIIALEVFVKYHVYVRFLKWLTLSVFAYIITGIIIRPDWSEVFSYAIIPRISFSNDYLFAMVAVFGTTITPYLFFWQASEEVEDGKMEKRTNGHLPSLSTRIAKMRKDVNFGMLLANVVFFFIVITTASTLFKSGITEIESAEQAALALRPIAGDNAYLLFALGIIGTGLLAIPVLAGSGAYAISEVMKWNNGLEEKFFQARNFYVVIAISILVGLSLNLFHINPITALYWSAFINGVIALPLLAVIMVVGNNKKIMGKETNPGWVSFFGWLSVVLMIAVAILSIILYFVSR
ncbi:MAG TPA: iron transporter [Candidatus Moranbacteria bacterium]|nr:MAG: Natural resistance-associated macrophage protein [Candidatus Moranbacteria bacterium GW2011_GWC2_45_10]KKT94862.1 MAG: hypothetical protein UW95_C0007G0004 [Parcubacteria group bacterium GW2011_GWC1_45_14]HAV11717.1 iron transporter [Candidatus Moranbacteria bacterium]